MEAKFIYFKHIVYFNKGSFIIVIIYNNESFLLRRNLYLNVAIMYFVISIDDIPSFAFNEELLCNIATLTYLKRW